MKPRDITKPRLYRNEIMAVETYFDELDEELNEISLSLFFKAFDSLTTEEKVIVFNEEEKRFEKKITERDRKEWKNVIVFVLASLSAGFITGTVLKLLAFYEIF